MKIVALDIPNDPDQWPEWLEKQLVGLELHSLVAQLEVLAGSNDSEIRLADVLGDRSATVLEYGLSRLNKTQIQQLIKTPRLLFDLQELVFIDGGEYWESVPITDDHRNLLKRETEKLKKAFNGEATPQVAIRRVSRRNVFLYVAAVAATVLTAAGTWWMRPRASGWGFDRDGLLAADVAASEYLNILADASDDWYNKRPRNKDELVTRLTQFRDGCDTLLAAPHPQLALEDRAWLVQKCRLWRAKISNHLSDLTSDKATFEQTLQEANGTVDTLRTALKNRAESLDA